MKKTALATAAAGVASTLLARGLVQISSAASDSPVMGCCSASSGVGVEGSVSGCDAIGVKGISSGINGYGVEGCSSGSSGLGVYGIAAGTGGRAVEACSRGDCGYGVFACASGTGYSFGVYGRSVSSSCGVGVCGSSGGKGVGVRGSAIGPCATPLVAKGTSKQSAYLQEWQNGCGKILSAVNKDGWLGISSICPYNIRPLNPICVAGTIAACSGSSGAAILGHNITGAAVLGQSCQGVGVEGVACCTCAVAIVARGRVSGQIANLQQWEKGCPGTVLSVVDKCGWFGIGTSTPSTPLDVVGAATVNGSLSALACAATAVPIVARGASGQIANLQQWEASCGAVYAVVNKAGSLGLGGVTNPHHVLCISGKAHASSGFSIGPCTCINTTLVVNGSMAAKTRCVSASGCLATTDYGIFASGTITLTLPPAKTQKGMMLFIKNTSTSTVTIKPGGTDTIEGAKSCSPKSLPKQYDSVTLISNGTTEWFIQSGTRCGVAVS